MFQMRWMKYGNSIEIRNTEECPSVAGNRYEDALQAEKTDIPFLHSFFAGTRRVFLWILDKSRRRRRRGALTVEAAVAVPVFLLAMSSILGILDIYRIQALVKTSLHQSALELGMYAYVADAGENSPVGVVSSSVCALYAKSRLPDLGRYVKVSTAGSSYREGEIDLIASVEYRLPLTVIPLPPIRFKNESKVNAWTGWNGSNQEEGADGQWEEMVYVSEYESVYHTSSSCTHINLAIHQGSIASVEDMRNAYGEKYHSCEKCGSVSDGGTVYYTEKGNRYHCDENCSGLKRTVRLVKKSEVHASHQCERCKAREES